MNDNKDRQHRRIIYEVDAIVRFSRMASTYSVVLLIIALVAIVPFAADIGRYGVAIAVVACLLFALINYAVVLALLCHFLLAVADVKTPLPRRTAVRYTPVYQGDKLVGRVVTGGGGEQTFEHV